MLKRKVVFRPKDTPRFTIEMRFVQPNMDHFMFRDLYYFFQRNSIWKKISMSRLR